MTAHVIEDGQDFGVPTNLLASNTELLSLPAEQVDARVEQRAAWRPTVVPMAPPTDHALVAQKIEAGRMDVQAPEHPAEVVNLGNSFAYDGETYWISPAETWDLEIFELIEDGKMVTACHKMVGDEQWKKFKAKPRTAAQFNEFFLASQEALSTKSR